MLFKTPLITGTLIQRYKRFMVDVTLDNGTVVTAHCPNSGAMTGIKEPGYKVWLSRSDNPKRKLKYTLEMVDVGTTIVGANTQWPNDLAEEAILNGTLTELQGYPHLKREVKYGTNSRIDILLGGGDRAPCYVEMKNVHNRYDSTAFFPDAVTERGTKHMRELKQMVLAGYRAVVVYVIQRNDCTHFDWDRNIDPVYADASLDAMAHGVEFLAYGCTLSPEGIIIDRKIPLLHSGHS